jgi:hypothetical protein
MKALPRGKYLIRCKERTLISAAANGHSLLWPSCEAISDGAWVTFVRDGKEIYRSNAVYAAAHFEAELLAQKG